jgi:hypothetical protein
MNRKALSALFLALGLVACGDDDEAEGEDGGEEVITTLTLTFVPDGGGTPVVATFRDPDGEGGDPPTQLDDIVLTAGTTYQLQIEALNETVPPSDPDYRIIDEIIEEAEEHQFFFTGPAVQSDTTPANPNALAVVAYDDVESDYVTDATDPDLPVGVLSTVTAAGAAGGPVTQGFVVTLQHQPPNGGVPVKTPDSGISDGDTDIEVAFDITVQ